MTETRLAMFPKTVQGDMPLEMTFGLIKSHAVRQNRIGIILSRILQANLIVMMAVETTFSGEQILELYREHTKKPFWPALLTSVSGPVVPMVIAGKTAVAAWRGLLGATDPGFADVGTLRADFGNVKVVAENVAHGSDSLASAKREIALFFPRITLT